MFEKIIAVIDKHSKPNRIPFSLRIPEGDVIFYRAVEHFVKQGKIEYVIPSTLHTREPIYSLKPYMKWKDYGCKIYGRIDGWKCFMWHNINVYLDPKDIKEDINRFFKEGADGVFVYQADLHLADAYTKNAINKHNW